MVTKTFECTFHVGQQVKFVRDNLGASPRDSLHAIVDELFGVGDGGLVAFAHPHPQLKSAGWFYVEVVSKRDPDRLLYVGVNDSMVESAVRQ